MGDKKQNKYGSRRLLFLSFVFLLFVIWLIIFFIQALMNDAQKGYKEHSPKIAKFKYKDRIKLAQNTSLVNENQKLKSLEKLKNNAVKSEVKNTNLKQKHLLINKEKFNNIASKNLCLTCHSAESRLIGPSFKAIANEYKNKIDEKLLSILMNKIKKGSIVTKEEGYIGPWEKKGYPLLMPANGIANDDLKKILLFILNYK